MNKSSIAVISFLLAGAISNANAANFYGLADFGSSSFKFATQDFQDSKQTAFDLGAGYAVNDNFAAELAYRDLGDTFEAYNIDAGGERLDVTVLQLSAVGKTRIGENLDLYGRLGYARFDLKVTTESYNSTRSYNVTGNRLVGGLGINYEMSENIDMRVEYTSYAKLAETTFSTLTLGLNYHFK
jgi:OOP family OmpA-OmpF porin